jgi:hypothetical protein
VNDVNAALIRQWQASPRPAEQAAARIAAELAGKQRWHPLDGTPVIAARLGVPAGTVRAAKALLAGHGLIMKSAGRFYLA